MPDDGCPSPESETNAIVRQGLQTERRVSRHQTKRVHLACAERQCSTRRGLPMLVVRDTLEQAETHAEMTSVREGAGDE